MRRIALMFVLLTACSFSWAAGKPNENKNVTLTIEGTCTATSSMIDGRYSMQDSVTVNMTETITYRIVDMDDHGGAELEEISHTNSLSASGGGSKNGPGTPKKWTYKIKNQIETPLGGAHIQYGTGALDVYFFNYIHTGELESTEQYCDYAGNCAAQAMGCVNDPMHTSDFSQQCKKSFKPWPKDLFVTGTASHHYNFTDQSGQLKEACDLSFHYTVSNNPPQRVEAVLIPKGDYKGWLPGASTQSGQAGNQMSFTVELRDAATGEKAKDKTAEFEFELEDVSHEPGSCMNSPWTDTNPDLRFTKDANPGLASVSDARAESNKGLVTCPIAVSCFDGGAHGRLKVFAHLDDEDTVLAAKMDGVEEVQLPYDLDDNHIADAWEQQNKVVGKEASLDDEDQPAGDHNNGDGLTIWEEYRGFLEDGKHIRTDPRKKDFFICDTMGGHVPQAIDKLKTLTSLDVHGKLRIEELDQSHIINRNHAQGPHAVDQHGVIIVPWSTEGLCKAMGGPGTPKSIKEVLIDPTTPLTKTIKTAAGPKTYPEFVPTVVHELLHCLNVRHHGETDTTVWWKSETVAGKTDIYEFTSMADTDDPAKGRMVSIYDETDMEQFDPLGAYWLTPRRRWLGSRGGQHSGCEDCVMRYDCAQGYISFGVRYDITNLGEPVGQGLCTSPIGTGVNASGRSPTTRYGDAADKRGDCVDQICVNDLYH